MLYLLQVGRSVGRPPCNTHTICCCITGIYNKVFIILTYNFSKEKYVFPEDRPTSQQGINIHTICGCIAGIYNKVFIFLTDNFSKEQYVLPENDLRIETCRSILNVLV